MKDLATQAALCAVLITLTVLAFGHDVQGALYMLKFYVWVVLLPLGVLAIGADQWAVNMAKRPPPTRTSKLMSRATHGAMLGALVWTGHGFTAAGLAVAWLFCAAGWHHADKLRAKASAPAAV
jgi:hypothetical protein